MSRATQAGRPERLPVPTEQSIEQFFDTFSPREVRDHLMQLTMCALGSPEANDWSPIERADLVWAVAKVIDLVEDVHTARERHGGRG